MQLLSWTMYKRQVGWLLYYSASALAWCLECLVIVVVLETTLPWEPPSLLTIHPTSLINSAADLWIVRDPKSNWHFHHQCSRSMMTKMYFIFIRDIWLKFSDHSLYVSGMLWTFTFRRIWGEGGQEMSNFQFWVKMAKFPGLCPIGGNVENAIIGLHTPSLCSALGPRWLL